MKIPSLKTILGGAVLSGTFLLLPVTASALDAGATTTSSVRITRDGMVHVVNAEVTSVAGNIINAISRIKNVVVNWTFSTDASTKVNVSNSTPASNDVLVGDRVNVAGALTAFGPTLGLTAGSVTSFSPTAKQASATKPLAVVGKVTSVDATRGTFVLRLSNDRFVTVETNASTTWKLRKGTSTLGIAQLAREDRVAVSGSWNADGTVITATHVVAKIDDDGKDKKEKDRTSNKGSSHGLKNGWKDKDDRMTSGEHRSPLQAFLGNKKEGR